MDEGQVFSRCWHLVRSIIPDSASQIIPADRSTLFAASFQIRHCKHWNPVRIWSWEFDQRDWHPFSTTPAASKYWQNIEACGVLGTYSHGLKRLPKCQPWRDTKIRILLSLAWPTWVSGEKKKLKEAVNPVLSRIPFSSKIVGRRYGLQNRCNGASYHESSLRKKVGRQENMAWKATSSA